MAKKPTLTWEQAQAISQRMIREAIERGTHSSARQHFCTRGNHWVPSLFHKETAGPFVCWDCAPQSERDKYPNAPENRRPPAPGRMYSARPTPDQR